MGVCLTTTALSLVTPKDGKAKALYGTRSPFEGHWSCIRRFAASPGFKNKCGLEGILEGPKQSTHSRL
jgi:hypothetical protein